MDDLRHAYLEALVDVGLVGVTSDGHDLERHRVDDWLSLGFSLTVLLLQ